MSERSYDHLPGFVDLSQKGLITGYGEAFQRALADQLYDAQVALAAEKNPGAAAARNFATTQSIEQSLGPRCSSCGEHTPVLSGARLCPSCEGPSSLVYVSPAQVTCSLCDGRGTVDAIDNSLMIEKPLVAGSDE